MDRTKTDQRSKYTQMIVKSAMIKLLSDKPLNKISVAELCATAEINRGTFYNHFYDVYDVYEKIENELFDEVKRKLEKVKTYDLDKSFFKEVVLLMYKNIDVIALLFNSKTGSKFLDSGIQFVKDKFIKEWSDNYKNIPEKTIKYNVTYAINGGIGIIAEWIKDGMKESLDEIASLIERYNKIVFAIK